MNSIKRCKIWKLLLNYKVNIFISIEVQKKIIGCKKKFLVKRSQGPNSCANYTS